MANSAKERPRTVPVRKHAEGSRSYSYSYRYYGYHGYQREKRPRQLNSRLLMITLLVLAVGIPSTYFWHRFQLRRLSVALFAHAEKMEAEGRWREASDAYYRYWKIRPEPEALGRLAPAYDKASVSYDLPGVVSSYQRAVGALPEHVDLRLRLSELLTLQRQYGLALEHADRILQQHPDNWEARKCRAMANVGQFRQGHGVQVEAVLSDLEEVFAHKPRDLELANAITRLIRQDMQAVSGTDLSARADAIMNGIVAAAPNDPYAYLARSQYRRRYELPGASADLDRALTLAPDNFNVVRIAGWDAVRDKAWLSARALFKRAVELRPDATDGYLGLGDIEFFAQRPSSAVAIWNQARQQASTTLPLLLRLAEGEIQLKRLNASKATLAEIEEFVGTLASRGAERDRGWITGHLAMLRGNWFEANNETYKAIPCWQSATLLGREGKALSADGHTVAYVASLKLGETYSRLQQWEDAAATFELAIEFDVKSPLALLSAAEAWSNLNNVERAVRYAKRAVEQSDDPDAQFDLAKYLLQQQLRQPVASRDFSEFEQALAAAREKLPNSWQLRLLEIDYLLRQENHERQSQALAALWSVEQEYPHELDVWRQLPFIYQAMGHNEEADRAIRQLEQLSGSSVATKIILTDLLLWRGDTHAARRVLDEIDYASVGTDEQRELDFARLRVQETVGERSQIETTLLELTDRYPHQHDTLERLLELRLLDESPESEANPSTAALIERLKAGQGEVAGWQYYAVRAQLAADQPADNELIRWLKNRRPHWSKTKEIEGRQALRLGDPKAARLAFESADVEERGPQVCRLLLDAYAADGEYLAAWRMLDVWRAAPLLSRFHLTQRALLRHRCDVQITLDQHLSRAVDSPINDLWELMLREKLNQETDDLLARRLAKYPGDPGLLMLNLRRQLAYGDADGAAETIAAVRGIKSDDVDPRFILGQALEAANQLPEARDAYASVPSRSRSFTSADQHQLAITARLRELDQAGAATLAMSRSETADRSNKRLQAVTRLRRAGKTDLAIARELLESLVNRDPDANDRMLLASCYEGLGLLDAAHEQLRQMVDEDPTAHHLAVYIEFLLRTEDPHAATEWLERLEAQSQPTARGVQLRGWWLQAMGRGAEVKPLVERFALRMISQRSDSDLLRHLREVAWIYQELEMPDDSERWLRFISDRFPDQTEPLQLLLREDQTTEHAIQLCVDRLEANPSPDTATLLARIMLYGRTSEPTRQHVLRLLDDSLRQFPDDASFLFALGNLRLKHGQVDQAIELLQRVTEVNAGHYLAWNNLAHLLAERSENGTEAMECIDKAIAAAVYEVPTLRDTKAVVLMRQGQYEHAAEILEEVTQSNLADDPRFFFHHALVLDRLRQAEAAQQALSHADDLGLEHAFLTDYERTELTRLQQKLMPLQHKS